MPVINPISLKEWKIDLYLEAIYYYSAWEYYRTSREDYKPLKKVIDIISGIDKKIRKIESKYKNKLDAYDEIESYCIQLDSYYSEMSDKYTPVIKGFALVHILNALCLEACINITALQNITPKSFFEEFDKLSIEGKWLFLPKLMGKSRTFDKGKEPFQGFRNIIKWRNKLVHFKGKSDDWRGFLPPRFESLGLTPKDAEKSCKTTTVMIKLLCLYCDLPQPKWLDNTYWQPFGLSD